MEIKIDMKTEPDGHPDFSKEGLERRFIDTLLSMCEIYDSGPIAFEPDGITFEYAGKRFLFSMDVVLVKELV